MTSSTLDSEIAALKSSFCYHSYRIDLDYLLEDLERPIFHDDYLQGRSIFQIASDLVLDAYYEKVALEPLVKIYSAQAFRTRARFDRLLSALERTHQLNLIDTFWINLSRVTRNEYRFQLAGQKDLNSKHLKQFETYMHKCFEAAIDHLTALGRSESIGTIKQLMASLEQDQSGSLPPPTQTEKIDEDLFWRIISESADANDINDQLLQIADKLTTFRAADIKRFISLYAKHMKSLYHWNVWALAYAARGGCSDTAFEFFRTWLICQGDRSLLQSTKTKPLLVAPQVPKDPMLPADSFLLNLLDVYYKRANKTLSPPNIDTDTPRGKRWKEETFAQQFPELARHYNWI